MAGAAPGACPPSGGQAPQPGGRQGPAGCPSSGTAEGAGVGEVGSRPGAAALGAGRRGCRRRRRRRGTAWSDRYRREGGQGGGGKGGTGRHTRMGGTGTHITISWCSFLKRCLNAASVEGLCASPAPCCAKHMKSCSAVRAGLEARCVALKCRAALTCSPIHTHIHSTCRAPPAGHLASSYWPALN